MKHVSSTATLRVSRSYSACTALREKSIGIGVCLRRESGYKSSAQPRFAAMHLLSLQNHVEKLKELFVLRSLLSVHVMLDLFKMYRVLVVVTILLCATSNALTIRNPPKGTTIDDNVS